ncbi:hypothetical protein BDV06DRAFT_207461 [Aspergillus oleicola]
MFSWILEKQPATEIQFLNVEASLNHLVVTVRKVYITRLAWDEFLREPTDVAEMVKEAGWDWDELNSVADSMQGRQWKEIKERLYLLRCKARYKQARERSSSVSVGRM